MKKKLQVNVSGGRTSAYMAKWLKDNMSDTYDMIFIFANTGAEDLDTYRFLQAVDENFGLNLVLVECVIHKGRVASTHTEVTFDTLDKDGGPFKRMAAKYGISNVSFKHCNREMKFNPMKSYTKSVWPGEDYEIAIGIRPDETRRVSETATTQGICYPLIELHPAYPMPDKTHIIDWFRQFEWDLRIPEYKGNCITCYKKTFHKLNMVYQDNPVHFRLFEEMEEKYGHIKPKTDPTPGNRKWWRGYMTTKELLEKFREQNRDTSHAFDEEESGGCSESCEIFEMVP